MLGSDSAASWNYTSLPHAYTVIFELSHAVYVYHHIQTTLVLWSQITCQTEVLENDTIHMWHNDQVGSDQWSHLTWQEVHYRWNRYCCPDSDDPYTQYGNFNSLWYTSFLPTWKQESTPPCKDSYPLLLNDIISHYSLALHKLLRMNEVLITYIGVVL